MELWKLKKGLEDGTSGRLRQWGVVQRVSKIQPEIFRTITTAKEYRPIAVKYITPCEAGLGL